MCARYLLVLKKGVIRCITLVKDGSADFRRERGIPTSLYIKTLGK